jgi:hypothetical protein
MGDDDDNPTLHRKGILAMTKLAEQYAKGKMMDDYYFPPNEILEEELLRDKHPTLQDAWEKYQLILTLCKVENNER